MSIDEVMGSVIEYGILSRRATVIELRSFRTSIKAAIEQHVAEAVKRERDECARVCDDIRAYRPTTGAGGLIAEECVAAIRDRAEKETT